MKHANTKDFFCVISKITNPLKQLQRFLSALALFLLAPVAWSATYYVDINGNNANSGSTLSAPFKTIQKGMDTAIAGDNVYVRGGIYREQVAITRHAGSAGNLINLLAYNKELPVIKGSEIVTGWTQHSGNIWKKTDWPFNSQQVFVGGGDTPSLQQIGLVPYQSSFTYPKPVGSGVSSMVAGSFFYDKATTTLYVWLDDDADPNTKVIEASVRRNILAMTRPYIHVKGFAFRHSNGTAFAAQGAAVSLSSYSVIEQSDIQYTDFAGLSLGYLQTGAQAINMNLSNNGDSGVIAAASYGFLVSNSRMNGNNTRHFNALWHAGGLKAATKAYGTIEDSEVANNYGSGIWFDYCNSGQPIVIRNNNIHNNGPVDSAIFMEVSRNGLIYNNLIVNNSRRGIYLSGSDNMKAYNNTIVGTVNYAAIELGGVPRAGATLTNNSVRNNIILNTVGSARDFMIAANGATASGNSSDYNDIYRANGATQIYWGRGGGTWAKYKSVTGHEAHGLSVDPLLAINLSLGAQSQVIDKGVSLPEVKIDYLHAQRNGSNDMGALKNNTAVVDPPSDNDTTPPIISVSNPTQNAVIKRGSSIAISGKATDNVAVKSMTVYVDNASNLIKADGGKISTTWNSTGARPGTHIVFVSAFDANNNRGWQMLKFIVK